MYELHEGVGLALVDRHPVFLDLNTDRYLTLSPEDATVLLCAMPATRVSPLFADLKTIGLIKDGPSGLKPCEIHIAVEVAPPARTRISSAILLLIRLVRARLDQRTLLKRITDLRKVSAVAQIAAPDRTQALLGSVEGEAKACRTLLSSTDRCLPDAIAIATHLRRRGVDAKLVFGVRLPFAAHAWVQVDDVVVGDRPDRISAFTPILVV